MSKKENTKGIKNKKSHSDHKSGLNEDDQKVPSKKVQNSISKLNLKLNKKLILGAVVAVLVLLTIIGGYFGYSFLIERNKVEAYLNEDYSSYSEVNKEVQTVIESINFEQNLTKESVNEQLEKNASNLTRIQETQQKIESYKNAYSSDTDEKALENLPILIKEDLENDYQTLESLKKDLEFKSCVENRILVYLETNKKFKENSQSIVNVGENPDQANGVINSIIGEIDKTIQNNAEVKKCYQGDFEEYGSEEFDLEIEGMDKYFTDLKNILNSMKQNMRVKDSSALAKDSEALKEVSKREISTKTPSFILNYKDKLKINERLLKDQEFGSKVESKKQEISSKYYVSK